MGMLVTAAATMGLALGQILYPTIVCALGLIGLVSPLQLSLRAGGRVVVMLILALVILAKSTATAILDVRAGADETAPLFIGASEYLLTLMALHLYERTPGDTSPTIMAIGLLPLVLAGQSAQSGQLLPFHALTLIYLVLAVTFAGTEAARLAPGRAPSTRRRHLVVAALLLLSTAIGWGGARLLDHTHFSARWWPQGLAVGAATDRDGLLGTRIPRALATTQPYTDTIDLNTLSTRRNADPDGILLRAFSKAPPGYLRTGAYHAYADGRWHTTGVRRRCSQGPISHDSLGRRAAFTLVATGPAPRRWTGIAVAQPVRGSVFAPLGTAVIRGPFDVLWVDEDDCLFTPHLRAGTAYSVAVPIGGVASRLDPDRRRRDLHLPPNIDPRLRSMAEEIFADRELCREKIQAVVGHLRQRYTYGLGVTAPPGTDPLTHFILDGHEGNCELFGSAATILLRLGGVPARYVVGCVAHERSPDGTHWIAHQRDTHAWSEAWDADQLRWVTVESTPAVSLPTRGNEPSPDVTVDRIARRQQASPEAPGSFHLIESKYGWLALMLATAASLSRWGRRRPWSPGSRSPVSALQALLADMDRRMKRHGMARAHAETLHAFARRIESTVLDDRGPGLANWYRRYACVRYGGRLRADNVHRLALARDEITPRQRALS